MGKILTITGKLRGRMNASKEPRLLDGADSARRAAGCETEVRELRRGITVSGRLNACGRGGEHGPRSFGRGEYFGRVSGAQPRPARNSLRGRASNLGIPRFNPRPAT